MCKNVFKSPHPALPLSKTVATGEKLKSGTFSKTATKTGQMYLWTNPIALLRIRQSKPEYNVEKRKTVCVFLTVL